MVKTEVVEYGVYGKALRIANDVLEAFVTLDVGPRVIRLNLLGMENMFYNSGDMTGGVDVSEMYGKDEKWRTYGGHRTWIAPEARPETYYPDHDPVDYKLVDGGAEFYPPTQRVTGMTHTLTVRIEGNEVFLTNKLKNDSNETKRRAIWGITVTDVGGVAEVGLPTKDTGLLHNRRINLWPYTHLDDPRLTIENDRITVRQDPNGNGALKIGVNDEEGRIVCRNKGQELTLSYTPRHGEGEYPDGNVSSEIYTNPRILEIETLGLFHDIKPGETVTHEEKYSLRRL